MLKLKSVLFLSTFVSLSLCLKASDLDFYSIEQQYIGVRPMAMGNAFTAVGGDYNTIFYNPAGLYDIEKASLVANLLQYGLSTGKNSMSDLYKDLSSSGQKTGSDRTTSLTNAVENKYGNYYYARFSPLSFFYTKPRSGFAVIPADVSLSIQIQKQVGPTIVARMYDETTVAYGHAWSLDSVLEGLRFGVTGKGMYRAYFAKVIPVIDFETNKNVISTKSAQEGGALDADIGLLHHNEFNNGTKLSTGFVVRNFFDFGYKENIHFLNKKPSNPPPPQTRLDLGVNYQLKHLWIFDPGFSFDLRDIGHKNASLEKIYHLGTEWKINLGESFHSSLMAGLNQGYLTYGISVQTLWYLLEFASYGEQVGTKDARVENRVNMFKFALYF